MNRSLISILSSFLARWRTIPSQHGMSVFALGVIGSLFFLIPHYALADLAGLSARLEPLLKFDVSVLVLFGIGGHLLLLAQSLLEIIVSYSTIWLDVMNNPVVRSGWHFVASLVNTAFILAFLLVALSIMFQWGNIQPKKIIFRLVVVAILINFTLLFVQAAVDIANVVYTTFLYTAGDVASIHTLLEPVFESMSFKYWILVGTIVASVGASFAGGIPLIGAVVSSASIGVAVGTTLALLPELILMGLTGVAAIIGAIIMLLLGLLLLLRILAISLLAIISPFALAALIFPQTEKYFHMWKEWFVKWLLVGVVMLFVLSIALAIMGGLHSTIKFTEAQAGFGWLALHPDFVSVLAYIMVFVSLMVGVLWITIKTTPMASKMLMAGIGGLAIGALAGIARVKTGGPEGVKGRIPERIRNKIPGLKKMDEEEESKKHEELKSLQTRSNELKGISRERIGNWARRQSLTTALNLQESRSHKEKEQMEQDKEKVSHIDTPEEMAVAIEKRGVGGKVRKNIALMRRGFEQGGKVWQTTNTMLSPKEKEEAISHIHAAGYAKEAEQMAASSGLDNNQIEKALRVSEKDKEKIRNDGYENTAEKLYATIKPKDIEKLSKDTLKEKTFQKAMIKYWNGGQIKSAIEHHGRDFTSTLQNVTEEITSKKRGVETLASMNPALVRYMRSTSAAELGAYNKHIQSMPKKEFEEMVNNIPRGGRREGQATMDEFIDTDKKEEGSNSGKGGKKGGERKRYSDSGKGGERSQKEKGGGTGDTGASGERKH